MLLVRLFGQQYAIKQLSFEREKLYAGFPLQPGWCVWNTEPLCCSGVSGITITARFCWLKLGKREYLTSHLPCQQGSQGPLSPSRVWFMHQLSSSLWVPPTLPQCPGKLTSVGFLGLTLRLDLLVMGMYSQEFKTKQGYAIPSLGWLPAGHGWTASFHSRFPLFTGQGQGALPSVTHPGSFHNTSLLPQTPHGSWPIAPLLKSPQITHFECAICILPGPRPVGRV